MKIKLKAKNCLYPMPVVLVGALVKGEPNYFTATHVGILGFNTLAVSMSKGHQTGIGIHENKTFSVNLPSVDLVCEVDLCGMVSGRHADKARLFETFYGDLKTAPMVQQCPLCMECRLVQTLDYPRHEVFIGEIAATHGDPKVMPNGVVDYARVNPLLFVMEDKGYWQLGPRLATAWAAGKVVKHKLA